MPFRPCPSGCNRSLSADDGHDRCLQCLGFQHTEDVFVDDSCACCGRMSMISLRSRFSFLKGLAPSAATRAGLSGSSRGSPAGALGDLRVTVRASPPGMPPRTSYTSRSEHLLWFPGDFAGPSHGAPSISFGAPSVDRMSITASGDGFTSSEDEGAVGMPPSGVVATAAPDPELTAMLAWAAMSIGLEVNRPPSPEPSWLDNWFLGAGRGSQPRSAPVPFFPEVHEELTKSWMAPFTARSHSSVSSVLTTLDGGAARGYAGIPQVERADTNAATWRNRPSLPSKACKLTAALAAKAYNAVGQAASALHAMAILQVHQAVRQATSHVQRLSLNVGGCPERPCLARGDCCPPGKGCNRAGPSSRDKAGVSQPLPHRTQERWSTTNPGSASLEPGFAQAPVQDADAQVHYQMHPAPELVSSDRSEERLHSCFDPSVTQIVPTVCVRVQGPPPWALPVSPCLYEGRRGRPYPASGSGRQGPQLPRRLAYLGPIQRAVVRSQGLGALAPQPVGASGQLGKEQALPCAENLFSRCGVRLGEYDGTPHGGTCPSSAELPEFLQRQECGTTETVSEAPGHMASAAAVTPLGLLHMRPLQHWLHSRVPRWAWRRGTLRVGITQQCHRSLSPWKVLAFLQAVVPLEQVSRHTVVTTDASSTGWGPPRCSGWPVPGKA